MQHMQTKLLVVSFRILLTLMAYMSTSHRTIHLQTFKYTFTGQQAVTFLQQQGMAGNLDVAADLCQRMLTQGLFKSSSHREVFLADGEVYRFSSSFPDGHKQKGRCGLPASTRGSPALPTAALFLLQQVLGASSWPLHGRTPQQKCAPPRDSMIRFIFFIVGRHELQQLVC
jgi:hypothetical protein